MRFVEWSRLFEINSEEINRQHQELFEITNKFHEEFLSHHNAAYNAIKRDIADKLFLNTLNKLIKYSQEHFSYEENLLKRCKTPENYIKRHGQIHNKLMEDIFNISARFSNDTSTGIAEVETFLSKWLILHILVEDKRHNQYF